MVRNICKHVISFKQGLKTLSTLDISHLPVIFPLFLYSSISSLGRQDLVTQFLVKITFLYKLVAKKLDFVLSKLQISI